MRKFKLGDRINRNPAELRILGNDIELEEPCWHCVESWKVVKEECEFCNGIRFQLTDNGRAIIALVENHTDYIKRSETEI